MTQHLDGNAGDRSAGSDKPVRDKGRESNRELRRRFLLGGAASAGAIVTLASRPALATQNAANVCTVSALGSVNPSRPLTSGTCGDSPGCWKGHDFGVWADGATFNGIPVLYTHSTNITTVFPLLASAPFKCTGTTLANMINGGGSVTIKMQNGISVAVWTSGQMLNIVAAILNNYFYGVLFFATDILHTINNTLGVIKVSAANNNSSAISMAADQLDILLNKLDNQGETCEI